MCVHEHNTYVCAPRDRGHSFQRSFSELGKFRTTSPMQCLVIRSKATPQITWSPDKIPLVGQELLGLVVGNIGPSGSCLPVCEQGQCSFAETCSCPCSPTLEAGSPAWKRPTLRRCALERIEPAGCTGLASDTGMSSPTATIPASPHPTGAREDENKVVWKPVGGGTVRFGGKQGRVTALQKRGDICVEGKRAERICQFGEGTAGRRNSLHKGTEACYGNSKSPLWAPVAEWKVLGPLANWGQSWDVCACGGGGEPRAQACHRAGLGGGGQPHQGGAFYLFSISNVFPCLLHRPLSYRKLSPWLEGRERWRIGTFYQGGSFPLPWRPPLAPKLCSPLSPL